jgi:hypothetical protein
MHFNSSYLEIGKTGSTLNLMNYELIESQKVQEQK